MTTMKRWRIEARLQPDLPWAEVATSPCFYTAEELLAWRQSLYPRTEYRLVEL